MSTDSEQGHRWHDMGGRDAGEIARGEHDHALWEKRVDALMRIASAKGYFTVDGLKLVAVENTDKAHNVIVCTLCSCYPHNLLGLPPDWYKTRAYRSRTVKEPRAVLHEFGLDLLEDVRIQVHDSTADMRYMVLSRRPEGTEGWSREQLEAIVSRDCMIGDAVPRPG